MITKQEQDFIARWEEERKVGSSFRKKVMAGLPVAMFFGLPVLALVILVQFFAPTWFGKATQASQQTTEGHRIITKEFTDNPEWYNRVTQFSTGTFITIIIAVFIAVLFFAYFRISYKQEMNEQLYLELKEKQKRGAAIQE